MNLEDRIPAGAVAPTPGGMLRGASYGGSGLDGSSTGEGAWEGYENRGGEYPAEVKNLQPTSHPNIFISPNEENKPQNANSGSVPLSKNNMNTPEHQALYAAGYEMRKAVVGPDYVASALSKNSSDFTLPLQQFATESAWGTIWTRPGLSLRDRSLLNLVMLTALSKWIELGTHVRGAVRNGCSEVEIREALLQASAYCGLPAGMEAFRVADRVLNEMQEKGEFIRG